MRGQVAGAQPETNSGWNALAEREIKQHVARELHDRVAQTLTGMLIELETFKSEQFGRASVIREATDLQDSTRQVLQSIREMLYDLRGESSSEESFVSAVQSLLTRFEEGTRIAAELIVSPGWPEKLRSAAALNLYRIVEEGLTNIKLHSGASTVRVALDFGSNNEMALTVRDDGAGMEPEATRVRGMGMLGMRERAVLLGGRLSVETSPGQGTIVRAIVPKEILC